VKFVNIIVEGSTEEAFVNDVLVDHFAGLEIYLSSRKIRSGWDKFRRKPVKGGLLKYIRYRNEVLRWIASDRKNPGFWYTSMVDMYAFPKDEQSPYQENIQAIPDKYKRINALEEAIAADINHPRFIPYVQLHEFETLLLVDPDKLIIMYPEKKTVISRLKRDIEGQSPEDINESQQSSPSKRIIRFLPDYEAQKAQVGPLVAEDIGLTTLRQACPHFNEWISKLEGIQ